MGIAASGCLYIADTEAELPTSGMVPGALYYCKDTKRLKMADSATTCYGGGAGLSESGGQAMAMGAVADGQYLKRAGAYIVGGTPAGGSDAFPVGAVFIAVVSTNPATLLGYGTWSAFGAGRMPVGYNAADTDFDAAEKTGGAKTHTLSTAEMPSHTHAQDAHTHVQNSHNHTQDAHAHVITSQTATTGSATSYEHGTLDTSSAEAEATETTAAATATNQAATAVNQNATAVNQNTGGGGAHNNLPPYIVVHMWERTA